MQDFLANQQLYLGWLGRLLFAAFMGLIIGYERERGGRPAGLRTHMLVALGSSIVMVTSFYLVHIGYVTDVTRLGAQVISGIGFLGAGSILKSGTGVKGLTTAATLWIVAGIGLAAGSGFLLGAGFGTLITYITLKLLKILENKFIRNEIFSIFIPNKPEKLAEVTTLIWHEQMNLLKISSCDNDLYKIDLEVKTGHMENVISVFTELGYAKIELSRQHEVM